MKKTLLLLCALLSLCSSGAWADTWSTGITADLASASISGVRYIKVKTPEDVSGLSFTSFSFKHKSNSATAAYLAFSSTTQATLTNIAGNNFIAISTNQATTSGGEVAYTFSSDVVLLSNSYYYIYFLTSNGNNYNIVDQTVAVQTGQSSTNFIYSNSNTGYTETTKNEWRPYYSCTYSEVDLSTCTITYTCEDLSGYQLVGSTESIIESGTKFTPPTAPAGYTLDNVYDSSDEVFGYANTTIDSDITLKLKYHLTTNPFEAAASSVASPTWYTIKVGNGDGDTYLRHNGATPTAYCILNKTDGGLELSYPIDDKYLWCLEGNETDGYLIYNKDKEQYLGPGSEVAATGTDYYRLALLDDDPGNNTRWTLIYEGNKYYLYSVTDKTHINKSSNYPHYYTSKMGWGNGVSLSNALELYQTNYPYSAIITASGLGAVGGYTTYTTPGEPATVDTYATFVNSLSGKIEIVSNAYYRLKNTDNNRAGYITVDVANSKLTDDKSTGLTNALSIWQISDAGGDKWSLKNVASGLYCGTVPAYVDSQVEVPTSDTPIGIQIVLKNGVAEYFITSDGTNSLNDAVSGAGIYSYWNEAASRWYLIPTTLPTITMLSPSAVAADEDVYMSYANNTGAAKQMPADVTVYKVLTGGTKTNVSLTEVTSKVVPSGSGVVLKATKGATIPLLPTSTAETLDGNLLTAGTGSDVSGYLLAYQKGVDSTPKFYKMTDVPLATDKAYLPSSYFASEVKELILSFDETTGIEAVDNSHIETGAVYNLSGQRVSNPTHGLYIVNGKKVIIK